MTLPRRIYSCNFAPTEIRNSSSIVASGEIWSEVFSPDAWIPDLKPVPVMLRHDRDDLVVGSVVARVVHDGWHVADFMLDPDRNLASVAYDRLKIGAPVSLGARSLRRDDNHLSGVRRHTVARLEHIALLAPGEIPGCAGAKVTRILEPSSKPIVRQPASTAPARRPVVDLLDDPGRYRLVSSGPGGMMYEELSREPIARSPAEAGEEIIHNEPGAMLTRYFETPITIR